MQGGSGGRSPLPVPGHVIEFPGLATINYYITQNVTEIISNIINAVTVISCNYCCNIITLYRFILNSMALDLFNSDTMTFLEMLLALIFCISRKCRSCFVFRHVSNDVCHI